MSNPQRGLSAVRQKPWFGLFKRVLVCVLALATLFSLCQARAEDHPKDKEVHAKEHEGHNEAAHKDDPFKGNIDLSIWSFGVFLVLMGILGKFAWPKVIEGLEKRESSISRAMQDAKTAQDEAAALRLQLQKDRDQASQQLRDLMEEARRNAQQLKEEMKNEAQTEIKQERDRLRREIATAQDQALQEIWKQSSHLATLISSKAIKRTLSEDDHRRLVDEALAEMGQVTKERQQVVAGLQ